MKTEHARLSGGIARQSAQQRLLGRIAQVSEDDPRQCFRHTLGSLAPAFEVLLDLGGVVADRTNGLLQLVLRDAELVGPVAQFVVLAHIDALAITSAALGEIVCHGFSKD